MRARTRTPSSEQRNWAHDGVEANAAVPPVIGRGSDDDVMQICLPGGVCLFQASTTSAR